MSHVEAIVCGRCGRRFSPDDATATCPAHDGPDGFLDVTYDRDAVRNRVEEQGGLPREPTDMWAFAPLLPVPDADRVSLGAGGTPLLEAPRLSDRLDARVAVKDETVNPTGSVKDRGSAVVVSRATAAGHGVVACASTGNAAASLAGYAARAGLDCRIVVPADLPEAKAVQPRVYGADVLAVDGSYEDAHEYCRHRSAAEGWYDCSAGATPYAIEGTRTLGFELGLGATAPDWVVVPMGNGGTLAAAWKGLRDVERLGYLDELPKMLGVQAAGATPIYDAFTEQESRETPAASGTAADSIDVRGPHSVARACRALEESDGDAVVVDDGAISQAQRLLGKSEGLFVEPASAAAVAGVEEARQRGVVGADEKVIVVATGTGLKDTATAKAGLDEVGHVGGDIDDS